jgi:hypothetical protein
VIAEEHRDRVFTKGAVLVDGFVHGRWSVERDRGAATLAVELFRRLGKADRAELAKEGVRLLAFAAAGAKSHDVRFEPGG